MTFNEYLLKHGIDTNNQLTDVSRVPELHRKFQYTNTLQAEALMN